MHFLSHKIHTFVYPNSLTDLYTLAQNAEKTTATIGDVVQDNYRTKINEDKCNAYFVNYTAFANKVQEVTDYCKNLMEETYKVKCISNELHFLYYSTGSQYWAHTDGQYLNGHHMVRADVNRDITCVTYLNDDYIGGEIEFTLLNKTIKPKTNDIIAYQGNYKFMHSVNSVVGNRYAIVNWFGTSPKLYGDQHITDINELRILSTI